MSMVVCYSDAIMLRADGVNYEGGYGIGGGGEGPSCPYWQVISLAGPGL